MIWLFPKFFKFGYNRQGFAGIDKFKEALFSFAYQARIKSLRVYPWFEKNPLIGGKVPKQIK